MAESHTMADRTTARALRLGLDRRVDPAVAARAIVELVGGDREALRVALRRIQRVTRERRGLAEERAAWFLNLALVAMESPDLALLG